MNASPAYQCKFPPSRSLVRPVMSAAKALGFSGPVISVLDGDSFEVLHIQRSERIPSVASTARRNAKPGDRMRWTSSSSHGCMVSFSSILIPIQTSCS